MLKHVAFMGAAVVAMGLTGPAQAQDASTVVATVGETDITLGEMIIIRAQLPQQYAQFPDDVLFEGILDQLIQQQLLADTAAAEPARVTYALRNERRSLMAGEVITEVALEAITEEALAEAYAARTDGVEAQAEWNASHLLVETEEEALAAKARVDGGEEFADVARDVSTGPTGPNGGNLGWFGAGQMVPEFENAVSTMDAGDVSDPVQTQFGWHIVTLNENRTKEIPGLDEMRAELTEEVREAAVTARLDELREAADITLPEDGAFDPTILLNIQLLEP